MNTIEIQKILKKQQDINRRFANVFRRSKEIGTRQDVVVVDAVRSIYHELGYIPNSVSKLVEEIEASLKAKQNSKHFYEIQK